MKEITLACEAFQKLLEEQLDRIRNMNGEKTDFSTKKQVTIGVIDGDGIGPIITAQATRVLEKLRQLCRRGRLRHRGADRPRRRGQLQPGHRPHRDQQGQAIPGKR